MLQTAVYLALLVVIGGVTARSREFTCDMSQCDYPSSALDLYTSPTNVTEAHLRDSCRNIRQYALCYGTQLVMCSPRAPNRYTTTLLPIVRTLIASVRDQAAFCDEPELFSKFQTAAPCLHKLERMAFSDLTHVALSQCWIAAVADVMSYLHPGASAATAGLINGTSVSIADTARAETSGMLSKICCNKKKLTECVKTAITSNGACITEAAGVLQDVYVRLRTAIHCPETLSC